MTGRVLNSPDRKIDVDEHELLVAEGLRKHWSRMPAPVLDGVSIELPSGSVTWLVGRNGVGKTTLMRILGGLIRPDGGTVRLGGLDPERDRAGFQRGVGYLSAGDRGLYARLTVRRHLEFWTKLAQLPRDERSPSIERAIDQFDLAGLVDARVDRTSMGQRQRVRLAMAFMHHPRLVLLDEPLNSLDDEGAALLNEAVQDLVARGGACLWISPGNDGSTLEFDQRLRLVDGKVVEQ